MCPLVSACVSAGVLRRGRAGIRSFLQKTIVGAHVSAASARKTIVGVHVSASIPVSRTCAQKGPSCVV